MEFDLGNLLELLLPAVGGAVAVGFAWALSNVRRLVKESENKWDDALLQAFDNGYEQAKAEQEEPQA